MIGMGAKSITVDRIIFGRIVFCVVLVISKERG
jgi:hypothetical protein